MKLERAHLILALTTESNGEEARTSAMKLCAEIRAGTFVLVEADDPRLGTPRPKTHPYGDYRLHRVSLSAPCRACGGKIQPGVQAYYRERDESFVCGGCHGEATP